MGFSGGGSNQTQPHTHDSNVVNDGGSLNANNVTQMGMAAGDITYSDGNHLQILTYPAVPAGEALTAVAATTAPSWAAGAAGATVTTQQIAATHAATTTSTTMTAMPNVSLTLPNRPGGYAYINLIWQGLTSDPTGISTAIHFNGSYQINNRQHNANGAGVQFCLSNADTDDLDGGTVAGGWMVYAGTGTIFSESRMTLFEVS